MHVSLNIFLFLYLLYFMFVFKNDVFVDCDIPSASPPSLLPLLPPLCPNRLEWNRQSTQRNNLYKGPKLNSIKHEIKISCYDALQMSVLLLIVLILLRFSLWHLCTHVSYVTFNTDLNLYSKKFFC
jgi:hypothetical protein